MIRRGFVVAVAVLSGPAAGFSPAALPALRRAGARVSSSASNSRTYMTVSPQAARVQRAHVRQCKSTNDVLTLIAAGCGQQSASQGARHSRCHCLWGCRWSLSPLPLTLATSAAALAVLARFAHAPCRAGMYSTEPVAYAESADPEIMTMTTTAGEMVFEFWPEVSRTGQEQV